MQTLSTRLIPLRAPGLVLAALVLVAILAVASPAQPAAASCGGVTTVSTEAELNTAIAAFNAVATSPCVFTIQLSADINLTASTTVISNTLAGLELQILGAGNTVDGQGTAGVRPFEIAANTLVLIGNITVTGGNVTGEGGGILNSGTLTVYNSTITGNSAGGTGGGIRNNGGSLTVEESTVSGNTADQGGGLISGAGGNTWVYNSTFSGNTATTDGGGIKVVSGGGTTRLDSVTIANNTAPRGSGIRVAIFGIAELTNTLIGDNNGSADCEVTFGTISGAYNLVESDSDRCDMMWFGLPNNNNNLVGVDPNLGPLANNGGDTQTHLPQLGSPVINAGDTTLTADQRGISRPQGAADDIGAVEVACPASPWNVANEGELNFAIGCYNGQTAPGVYTINITQGISLTASTTVISNTLAGLELQILGAGNTVDGQGTAGVRPFEIAANTLVLIGNITVTGGNVTGEGGGILNSGTLTVYNSTITGNSAGGTGGGIRNNGGSLTVEESTVSGNTADQGGGLISGAGGNTWVYNSTFSGNTATTDGGGIKVVSGGGTTRLDSVTIANNTAPRGSGIRVAIFGIAELTNTLIGDNNGSADCEVTFGTISGAYNLVESDSDRCDMMWFGLPNNNNNLVGVDPNLGPLANNGGDTQTHLPNAGSPVINAGATTQPSDQRGEARPQGAADDIGAVEVEASGTIRVVKVAQPEGPTVFDFQLAGFVVQDFTLVDDGTGNNDTFEAVEAPGNYTIEELPESGWRLESIVCDDPTAVINLSARKATVPLSGGETVTCTFTNVETPPGTITIIKFAEPADNTPFTFTNTIDNVNFTLQDPSNYFKSFSNVPPGQYRVTELAAAAGSGWDLTDLECIESVNQNSQVSVPLRAVEIQLDNGESVTCIFTNVKSGTIRVVKQAQPEGDTAFAFRLDGATSQDFTLIDNGTISNTLEVRTPVGGYTIREFAQPGWSLDSIVCDDPTAVVDGRRVTFTLDADETVTCTFTNTEEIPGTINIVKDATPADNTPFTFTNSIDSMPFTLRDPVSRTMTFTNVVPGAYYVLEEAAAAGWDLTDITCVESVNQNSAVSVPFRAAEIQLDPGETVTCTFENKQASIEMTKTVGTDPAVCATTDAITVTAGTEVVYCFTVANTGALTLTSHLLDDPTLGISAVIDYALIPGASVSITSTASLTQTTVNTATWTACNLDDPFATCGEPGSTNVVSDTDTALVTVVNPSIVMSKTVGFNPNVCATTSSIEVAAGTVVYYCYTVTNTGDVALPLHDLVDDQLGTLLDDFAFNLAPGATVSTVDAGAVISITASSTVTNTAVWTAFVDPIVTASYTDTATVTVVTPTAVQLAGLETGAERPVLLWPLVLAAALVAAVVAWRRLGTAR